jgi:hypothetical protein
VFSYYLFIKKYILQIYKIKNNIYVKIKNNYEKF